MTSIKFVLWLKKKNKTRLIQLTRIVDSCDMACKIYAERSFCNSFSIKLENGITHLIWSDVEVGFRQLRSALK